jgi:hypothetical protein
MHSMIQITGIVALTTTFALTMACGSEETKETGDTATSTTTTTATTEPTLLIDLVQSGCDKDGWFYYGETSAWTSDATVNAWEVRDDGNGWNEEHSVPSVDFDPEDPSYDVLERTLADGASVADYTRDVNTVFACGVHDQDDNVGMTYTMRVYDTDMNYADCAAWGKETAAVLSMPAGSDSVPSINEVTDAAEITADNCVVF